MANIAGLEAKKAELNDKFKAQRAAEKNTQTKKDDSIKQTTKDSIGTVAPKKIRVTVTLPENMFYALENECKKIGATKNGYIISMLSKKLDLE